MGKIFVLMGMSATGKDTIYRHVLEDTTLGLKPLVIYTTRPQRVGEKNGREYYFVDKETMKKLKEDGLILECRSYHTVNDIWYYFTVKDHQLDDSNFLTINTIDGYNQLKKSVLSNDIYPIYIEVPDYERLTRAINREKEQTSANYKEVCRRFLADKEDFSDENVKNIVPHYVNTQIEECIKEITNDIKRKLL